MSLIDIIKHATQRQNLEHYSLHNTNKFKQSYDLVEDVRWSVNELVTVVIHLAQKSKHIIKLFAIHSFPSLSQTLKWYFCEVRASAMWDVANCDMVCDVHLRDDVDDHSESWIGNGSDSHHMVTVHEFRTLPFVFVIRHQCCWIAMHNLSKSGGLMCVHIWWHTEMRPRVRWCCNWRKP